MVEVGVPGSVKTEPSPIGVLSHQRPVRVVLAREQRGRANQAQRAAQLAQELGARLIGSACGAAIREHHVISVNRCRLVDSEAVDVEVLYERDGAADEQLPNHLLVKTRSI